MFIAEAKGLAELKQANSCRTPDVLAVYEGDPNDALLLEYIEPGRPSRGDWFRFGSQLAHLHQTSTETFGLDHSNYMGSLRQSNQQHESFPEFFRNERLEPQIKLALKKGVLNGNDLEYFDKIYSWLEREMNDELPALVHGDLWSGNAMFSTEGEGVLIDPAVSYSSRHADLAMTTLFGGFPDEFYQGYQEQFTMESNVKIIWDVLNLYPLLIHVNLFGSGYLSQTRQILRMF
jgi:fructosamine-3-kinase